jgi:hypothetical protein
MGNDVQLCRWLRQLCFYFVSITHNLRCGLEEYPQLRWLVVSKNHAVSALICVNQQQEGFG